MGVVTSMTFRAKSAACSSAVPSKGIAPGAPRCPANAGLCVALGAGASRRNGMRFHSGDQPTNALAAAHAPTRVSFELEPKWATLGQRTRVTRDGLGTQCPGRAASATHTFPFAMNGEAGALNAG